MSRKQKATKWQVQPEFWQGQWPSKGPGRVYTGCSSTAEIWFLHRVGLRVSHSSINPLLHGKTTEWPKTIALNVWHVWATRIPPSQAMGLDSIRFENGTFSKIRLPQLTGDEITAYMFSLQVRWAVLQTCNSCSPVSLFSLRSQGCYFPIHTTWLVGLLSVATFTMEM